MTSIKITRRQFLKWLSASAAALGLSQTDLLKVEKALALGPPPDLNFPVAPGDIDIAEVVLEIITIDYSQIVMATSGDVPNNYLLSLLADPNYKYVLLVEGTIQAKAQGKYCRIMDLPGQLPPGIYDTATGGPYVHRYNDPQLGWRTDVTMAGGPLWLAKNTNYVSVVS